MTETQPSRAANERRATHPPAWAPWLLGLALPVAVLLELGALTVAGLVFPLFDPTPVFVLAVVVLSRRWDGVDKKWFTASAVVAAVMLVEWIAWDVWYYVVVFGGSISTYGFDQLVKQFGNPAVGLLLAEMIVLLVVFGRASIASFRGVKRVRDRA
jgi:hypothetical protein